MGHGIYSQCTNSYGSPFDGTDIRDNCMYDMANLATLPPGSSCFYVETKNSGGCFFEPSYFYQGYALPGTPSGLYHLIIGFGSPSCGSLSEPSPWTVETMSDGQSNTAYLWVIPGGVPARLLSFAPCGDQSCLVWEIGSAARTDGAAGAPPPAAFAAPEEGRDYVGDPRTRGDRA